MTKFIKFLRYDLKNGILSVWKHYLLALAFFLCTVSDFLYRCSRVSAKAEFHTRWFCLPMFLPVCRNMSPVFMILPFSGAVGAPVRSDLIRHAALYR